MEFPMFINLNTLHSSVEFNSAEYNDFTFNFPTILFDDHDYSVEVIDLRYPLPVQQNTPAPPSGIFVILTSDIGDPIQTNNTSGSILYKGQTVINTDNNTPRYIIEINQQSSPLKVKLSKKELSQIRFQLVRSDNGGAISIGANQNVSILLKIEQYTPFK